MAIYHEVLAADKVDEISLKPSLHVKSLHVSGVVIKNGPNLGAVKITIGKNDWVDVSATGKSFGNSSCTMGAPGEDLKITAPKGAMVHFHYDEI